MALQGWNYWILAQNGPNLGPNGQNLIKRPREPKETPFPHVFEHWVHFFHENLKFMLSGSKLANFGQKTGPNFSLNGQRGLESQTRSLFHMFLSTEYRFFIKSKILVLQGQNYPILSQDGPNLGPNDQNLIKRPREPNRPLFHLFLSTEYEFS